MTESRFDLSDHFTDVVKYKYKLLLADLNKYNVEEDKQVDTQVEEIENGIHVYNDVQNKIAEYERGQLFNQIGILFRLIQMQNYSSFILINLINDKFKSLGDQEEILSTVDAKIRTLTEVTAQELFSIDSLAAPVYSLVGNLNYAKMLQDINNYQMRMEQKGTLKVMKNALEVYKEFEDESKKRHLMDQILLLFLFMRMHFDPDNRTNLKHIFFNFSRSKFEEVTRTKKC